MTLVIAAAEPCHLRTLADNLRAEDAAELEAAGISSHKALWRSYRQAVFARTAFVDGAVAAVWGVGGSATGGIGRPWLLTAPPAERARVAFLREGRYEVAEMLAVFNELRGYVDGRYSRALRLLVMLGFSLSAPFPFGPRGVLFRRYSIRRL